MSTRGRSANILVRFCYTAEPGQTELTAMKHQRETTLRFLSNRLAAVLAMLMLLVACSDTSDTTTSTSTAEAPQSQIAEPVKNDPGISQYDARTFFTTTSYTLAGALRGVFSNDGESLLISSDQSGVFNSYRLSLKDGSIEPLTTSETDAIFAISWLADGERMLYTADQGGNELNHIYIRNADGSVTDLTPGEELKASFMSWNPDRSHLYIVTNERNGKAFDLYRYAMTDLSREMVYQNDDNLSISAISRDERYLALTRNDTSANSDVYLVDLNSDAKSAVLITEHEGDIAYGVYDFAPDSSALILASNEVGEFNRALRHDLTSNERSVQVEDDWDVSYVSYSPNGTYQIVGVNNDASTVVTVTDVASGKELVLNDLPPGDLQRVRFSADEKRMAFLVNGDRAPSNVFWVDLDGDRSAAQLTEALNPAIDASHLVEGTVVRYPSFDELQIPGILYRPHQASSETTVPAIVWVHGGPGGQSRKGYRAAIQHLVNHGYAVFAVNNRGSSGYGKTFFHMDDKKHGEVDLQDVVYARTYLETLDWVDGNRVGIMGGSYGGYMVAAALAFEPEVFDVGINIFGVTNWVRTLESIPPWWESFKKALYDEMGDPATDAERHRRISPLFHASNIVKPLLVVQGANDPRVLQVESDELVEAVRNNGTHVEYVVFEDEGHGFRKRENRITASDAYVTFLDRFLKAQ